MYIHLINHCLYFRSVLFKYMNPNMALVIAEGQDAQSKTMITVQIVDLVTGKIFFSANHKKVYKSTVHVYSAVDKTVFV